MTFVDVVADNPGGWADRDLDDLVALLQECFPDHPHVAAELRANAARPPMHSDRLVHQIVAIQHENPLGFIVIHANTARHIGLIHFLGIKKQARGTRINGTSLARNLVAAGVQAVYDDGVRLGLPLRYGVVAESEPEWMPVWEHWGFAPLPVDYAEPYHGMHWPKYGQPSFFEMTLMRQGNPAYEVSVEDATIAAVMAFSVDHYLLPVDHPRVAPMLRRSREA